VHGGTHRLRIAVPQDRRPSLQPSRWTQLGRSRLHEGDEVWAKTHAHTKRPSLHMYLLGWATCAHVVPQQPHSADPPAFARRQEPATSGSEIECRCKRGVLGGWCCSWGGGGWGGVGGGMLREAPRGLVNGRGVGVDLPVLTILLDWNEPNPAGCDGELKIRGRSEHKR
jgi:hypothetical protein